MVSSFFLSLCTVGHFLSALTRRFGCRNFKIDVEQMALEAAQKEMTAKSDAKSAV